MAAGPSMRASPTVGLSKRTPTMNAATYSSTARITLATTPALTTTMRFQMGRAP